MSDAPFELLVPELNSGEGSVLWLVDENISTEEISRIKVRPEITAMTNRFDVFQQLQSAGFTANLVDYELAKGSEVFDAVVYRVAKEKSAVHHIINRSRQWLKPDARLLLSGFKKDGIKTYIKKAGQLLGDAGELKRGDRTAQMARICNYGSDEESLDDKNYPVLRLLENEVLDFYSKPGVFGWQKIDKGSAFLVEQLPSILDSLVSPAESVLDLGCGYGYLSLMAAKGLSAKFTAVDNNITAVTACRKNFQQFAIEGEVHCDDCGSSQAGGFDLVLCNPPFHQGFDVESDLTTRFIGSSHRLLKPGGRAVFVVNAFIPLERKAADFYGKVDVVAKNKSFKVLMLSH